MESLSSRHLWLYIAGYCAFVALIHIPGFADYLHQFAGRQGVVIETVRTAPLLALQLVTYALTVMLLNLMPLALLLVSLNRCAAIRARLALGATTHFLAAVVALWIAVLCFNKFYFPRSSFAVVVPFDGRMELLAAGAGTLAVFLLLGVAPALWLLIRRLMQASRNPMIRVAIGGLLVFSVVHPLYSQWTAPAVRSEQPNIIIIGMDSVAPLHLERHPGALPILEKLLAESTVFDNNITPLARTFPAWTSILTAKYPVNSGARFNLTDFAQVDRDVTLPKLLKAKGYATVYAQDERQFNNIDESFGFDRVIGPAVGAADIVLSKAADHPLANLALLTPFAETLFPFVALNRAATVQYDPDDFVAAIVDALPRQGDKPLFLATHFCLAHLPYHWRDDKSSGTDEPKSMEARHIRALQRLEQQIDALLHALRASGRLDNAMVVILSDHGEALGYSDALWPAVSRLPAVHDVTRKNGYAAVPEASGFSGHGMNVLDRTEYQSVLAFQAFGPLKSRIQPGKVGRITSLVDVMPTLLTALGEPLPVDIDGADLLGAAPERNTRMVTAETGLRFGALVSIAKFDEATLLKESRKYYRVDPDSARLTLKRETYPELVSGKDLAAHTEDWMLGLLRKPGNAEFPRVAVLVHKPTGAWTIGNDAALIARAPMTSLTGGLRAAYGREIADFETLWPFEPSAVQQ